MKKVLLTLATMAALACGGIGDISDPDTHVFEQTIYEGENNESVTQIKDLGFDRDAYLEAMADQDRMWARGDSDSDWLGTSQQGITISGRYGTDSESNEDQGGFQVSQCPNNPPYTGAASINPNHNYCSVAASKLNKWWWDSSIQAWNTWFQNGNPTPDTQLLRTIFQDSLTANNFGTSWNNQRVSDVQTSLYLMAAATGQCTWDGVVHAACQTNQVAPIVLAQPTGARVRKAKADGTGWFGRVYVDFVRSEQLGYISLSMSQAQRNIAMANMFKHEVGHNMGFGHKSLTESSNIMGGTGGATTPYNFDAAQKSEATNYVP